MVERQHTPLILIDEHGHSSTLQQVPLTQSKAAGGYDEAWLRDLTFAQARAIPVEEIDPSFGPLIPVCKELRVGGGFADSIFLNHLGMPTLVECKLWRNPEARRKVVGQILEYASALKYWTYSDLQREAAKSLGIRGFNLVEHIRSHGHPDLDEATFVDNVSRNLASGRILLIVLGDGIREGVEAIGDWFRGSPGLHFTFGLVDVRVFDAGHGRRILQPRILAKTMIVNRTVISLTDPRMAIDGQQFDQVEDVVGDAPVTSLAGWKTDFWTHVFDGFKLDDAEQPIPPAREDNPLFRFATGSVWLRCSVKKGRGTTEGRVLVSGSINRSGTARELLERLYADSEAILGEIELSDGQILDGVEIRVGEAEALSFGAVLNVGDLAIDGERIRLANWFRDTINSFVNAVRPRIAEFAAELKANTSD